MEHILWQGCAAFLGSLGFAILCNIKGKNLPISALGGMIGWIIYIGLTPWMTNDIIRYFIATLVISYYSQTMARVRRAPTLVFLVIAFIPLVPGYSAYKAMEGLLLSDMAVFVEETVYTFKVVMAIATGFLVSSNVKLQIRKSYVTRNH